MKNLPFVLWLVLWPVSCALVEYLNALTLHRSYSESVMVAASLINLIIWVLIGCALWESE